jgi:ElaB/YqjD/DUF883 family membrane-anchored ribosome-binding protein
MTKSLPDQIADTASQVKDKVNELNRFASEKMNETRTAAAESLDRTASALHGSGEKVADFAHGTADKLASSAKYLRQKDPKSMMTDLVKFIQSNPAASIVAAVVIGFSVGRLLRSDD